MTRILTPSARPLPPLPKWILAALGLAFVTRVLELSDSAWVQVPAGVAMVPGFVAVVSLAMWAEARAYHFLSTRRTWVRLGGAALAPLAAVVVAVIALTVTGLLTALWDGFGGLVLLAFAGGFWLFSASVGSLVIGVIDVVVSALVKSFRARVAWAICSLVVMVVALCGTLAGLAVWLQNVMSTGELADMLKVHASGMSDAELRELLRGKMQTLAREPLAVAGIVFGSAVLIDFPAILSACLKLADAVMERLHPLSMALDEVSGGARDVRVEEAGSEDFIRLSQRFNRMVESLSLSERMERAFGMYVSGHVMERIRAQHGEALLPPSLREATVFFADIRGFTAFSERLPPPVLVDVLNRYFDKVVEVVGAHDGYLNKFIGDAVVVVFNGPLDQPDHAERGVRCALALQDAVESLNREGAFPELPEGLKVGVGVATGPMVCGNVGGARQVEYTVIGDTVNLSARLTSQAGPGEVWVNKAAAEGLPRGLAVTELPAIQLKGKAEPVVPWRVQAA